MASILNATTSSGLVTSADNSGSLQLATNNGTTAVTIDTSQNVGIGTASPSGKLHTFQSAAQDSTVNFEAGTAGYASNLQIIANNAGGGAYNNITSIAGGSGQWRIGGAGNNNTMVFSTGSSYTERMRITSGGGVFMGKTTAGIANTGFEYDQPNGAVLLTRSSANPMAINRLTNDGTLIEFYQDGSQEGNISVSGTTVSYNGGHLSRWSQLPNNQKDNSILKGTVMSNLDDMCVWTKDGTVLDNEQLNKMKVSDVEGDTNVAGVFVNWEFDEQYGVDDMNVAMTGDMIIRIADGVVVQKGDLLMSAGDGTAKPQGDDIVRSKTVAKVTSNHVTCTYADGSYCVPCVLMAC